MEREDEVRLLRKEMRFIEDRWRRNTHELNEYTFNGIRVIVNGISSRDFSFKMYLDNRTDNCLDRLREIGALTANESGLWRNFVSNWLPRVVRWREKNFNWDGGPSTFSAKSYVALRLARAGLVEFDDRCMATVTERGQQWLRENV
jgi:hypothetical protein